MFCMKIADSIKAAITTVFVYIQKNIYFLFSDKKPKIYI